MHHDKPLAAHGLHSFRIRGPYGWIMIGSIDRDDALREAARSTDMVQPGTLEKWDGKRYVTA